MDHKVKKWQIANDSCRILRLILNSNIQLVINLNETRHLVNTVKNPYQFLTLNGQEGGRGGGGFVEVA